MPKEHIEMNFCRRCGSTLQQEGDSRYVCAQGHELFTNAIPGVALILVNDANEVLVTVRAKDPGKGSLEAPGGLCNESEAAEAAIAREVKEEVGLDPTDYTKPRFLLSHVNRYEYGGEVRSSLDLVFTAKVKTNRQPVAHDDAASVRWVPAAQLDLDQVFFASVRAGYAQVIGEL